MKTVQSQKWVRKAKPRDSAVGVASQVLEDRMEAVWHYLELAATRPEEDIEYVHQLRVATRRASAACQVFRSLARRKRVRQLTKNLRQLRRAAGTARDLDVLCERLKKKAAGEPPADLAEAIACVEQRRQKVQKPLRKASRSWARGKRKRELRRLVRRQLWCKSKKKRRFGEVSSQVLASVVNEFFDATSADLSKDESLHEMRIQGKRLRYTIELVASSFDETLRKEVYPCVEEVQDRLGVVNDHTTAQQILTEWFEDAQGEEFGHALYDLAEAEKEQAEATRQEFLQWWNTQRAETLQERFRQLLQPNVKSDGQDTKPVAKDATTQGDEPSATSCQPESENGSKVQRKSKATRSRIKKRGSEGEAAPDATTKT
jgi:CHAD domain-containing protein